MSVRGAKERLNVQLHHLDGWIGATATGGFRQVEGWIRIYDSNIRPKSLTGAAATRNVNLWGKSRDGHIYFM